jgi:hypothetical protein
MRRSIIARLPTTVDFTDPEQAQLAVKILNQALQSVEVRLDTVQQIGARKPPNPTGFSVTGRQGFFYITWNRIKNCDGYVIMQATDTAMMQNVGRHVIADGQQVSFHLAVGNVAVTYSFQMYAYQGPQYSQPSPIQTATSIPYGAGEAALPTPPLAPVPPKIIPVRSGPNLS